MMAGVGIKLTLYGQPLSDEGKEGTTPPTFG